MHAFLPLFVQQFKAGATGQLRRRILMDGP